MTAGWMLLVSIRDEAADVRWSPRSALNAPLEAQALGLAQAQVQAQAQAQAEALAQTPRLP